ncbi:tetratricopeptide repeat protein SKI3 isoform X2 [Malania oleifera]|uniref:tetratricopeptide repeat protein SKI3 isoform X2 n=1 Tax=Malania oleifera TaxID=397392 RepID=UPI0025AE70AA|nr:tetratricopeptide repeat protein SKI3 isoform X2 [Malania oleifera]
MEKTEEEEEEVVAVLRRLQECVDSHPDDPSHHFNLGLLLWEKAEGSKEVKEKAAEHFVISVKLNPKNGAAFRYLGHYYSSAVSADTQRALKCYQRAVSLNPDDSLSGEALCDLLDEGGKESLQNAVCREASEKSPRAFWAFRRLGYLQALGLAYQRLGMFTAALKSYGRAVELEDSRVFALVESGNIFLMLGSYRKGVEHFQQALEICPLSISAYYGLASALLGLSKECINLGAFRWGASLLEEASKVAEASTSFAGNISCIWKLHGDIQLTYANCYPWMEERWNMEIERETFNDSVLSWKRTCYLAAMSANSSYQRALHLAPWQANLYTDIAVASDLVCSLKGTCKHDLNDWQLPEKMSLGSLLLEGDNSEFWVALGCLSRYKVLKQHAFIRGLQLDVSLSAAWAYLGKLYRKEGMKQLARQAFDCARSIDPLLALPWAWMSADTNAREPASVTDEAYESCLRAVQILPLAEFQIGLAKLALLSGHLSSAQVFGAIQQAVQQAPHYPESHNLSGLIFESQFDYQSAVASYRLARFAVNAFAGTAPKSHFRDISINLARSLSRAGNALAAVQECEDLKKEGLLDAQGLQIYAISLWKLGRNDAALSVVRDLAVSFSSMERTSGAVSISFICRLLYYISGKESAVNSILKMPRELLQSSKVSFITAAIHALDLKNRLGVVVSSSRYVVASQEENTEMYFLVALGKLIKNGSKNCLGYQSGVDHLRKVLHLYPNSSLIRNLLSYLLLSSKEWNNTHNATRCCILGPSDCINKGLKSGSEILGAGTVACYASSTGGQKLSFPMCRYQCLSGQQAIQQLQRWLHQEPWNHKARYLLILNLIQKAREEKFPQHLRIILERLIFEALSNKSYSKNNVSSQYQKFQLLLCSSEIHLQGGDYIGSINHAKSASAILLPSGYLFFAHLLLCRAYAAKNDFINLQEEYMKCLQCKTDYCIGWICLKFMKSQYKLQSESNTIELRFQECLEETKSPWNMWMAVFYLVKGLISARNQDFLTAQEFLAQACSLAGAESCLFLCHGAICMELARQQYECQFLSRAIKSLNRAQETSLVPLPVVSLLLAQAEASLGSKDNWRKNLHLEWFSWPPEMRPAELFLQMHLLARELKSWSESSSNLGSQSPKRLILQAIHLNPTCLRYWRVLQKLITN